MFTLQRFYRLFFIVLMGFLWDDMFDHTSFSLIVSHMLMGLWTFTFCKEVFMMMADICYNFTCSDDQVVMITLSQPATDTHTYVAKLKQLMEDGLLMDTRSDPQQPTKTLVCYQGDELMGRFQVPSNWKLTDILSQVDGGSQLRWRVFPSTDDQASEMAIVPPDNWPVDRLKLVWETPTPSTTEQGSVDDTEQGSVDDEIVDDSSYEKNLKVD